ncbi:MAG TPA: hypothetical protein VJN18_27930 [Polyangiaceae bacterium]|nr:hypothetical protein [Polyangiaceae bacterium]
MWRLALGIAASLLGTACSPARTDPLDGEAGASSAAGAASQSYSVGLGVPGGPDGLDFVPLDDGAELRLQTFGQGGTHLIVAVRALGFGNRAFVSAKLRNLQSGVEIEEPAPARPQLLFCGEGGFCDLVPYLVHASGLTETDEEKDGLEVELSAEVRNDAGISAQGSRRVMLSTADL